MTTFPFTSTWKVEERIKKLINKTLLTTQKGHPLHLCCWNHQGLPIDLNFAHILLTLIHYFICSSTSMTSYVYPLVEGIWYPHSLLPTDFYTAWLFQKISESWSGTPVIPYTYCRLFCHSVSLRYLLKGIWPPQKLWFCMRPFLTLCCPKFLRDCRWYPKKFIYYQWNLLKYGISPPGSSDSSIKSFCR